MSTPAPGAAHPVDHFFPTHLGSVRQAVSAVSRRRGLSADQELELLSDVLLKLIDDDYAALRQFRGECSLRTYLHTIAARALADRQMQVWGKWRPSAAARRLGEAATRIERLIVRERHTAREAAGLIAHVPGSAMSYGDALALGTALQARPRAPHLPIDEVAETLRAPDTQRAFAAAEMRRQATALRVALARALRRLPPADRHLLRLRFRDGLSVADIARASGEDQKRLYRRVERTLRALRAALEQARVRTDEALGVLAVTDGEIGDVFDLADSAA